VQAWVFVSGLELVARVLYIAWQGITRQAP
jgi:hypothetical protein